MIHVSIYPLRLFSLSSRPVFSCPVSVTARDAVTAAGQLFVLVFLAFRQRASGGHSLLRVCRSCVGPSRPSSSGIRLARIDGGIPRRLRRYSPNPNPNRRRLTSSSAHLLTHRPPACRARRCSGRRAMSRAARPYQPPGHTPHSSVAGSARRWRETLESSPGAHHLLLLFGASWLLAGSADLIRHESVPVRYGHQTAPCAPCSSFPLRRASLAR